MAAILKMAAEKIGKMAMFSDFLLKMSLNANSITTNQFLSSKYS
jgi:hypothetical protein